MNVDGPESISPAGLFPPLIWGEQECRWPQARYVFHYHSSDFLYCPGSLDPLPLHLPPRSGITSLPADDYPRRSGRLQHAQRKAGQFALIKLQREAGASVLSPVCSLIPFARSVLLSVGGTAWSQVAGPSCSEPALPNFSELPPGPPLHGPHLHRELIANDL